MSQNEIVVAVDVGTTKICVVVGDVSPDGKVRILGMSQGVSEGLRKGLVVDIETTSRNIRSAIDEASRTTGVEINSVVVGVTGEHVSSLNTRGAAAITHSGREITEHDVQRVLESARAISLPPDRELIHVLPRGFTVDGQKGVRQPVGMSGCQLEVETHLVTGSSCAIQNVVKSVQLANLVVESCILEPVASCEAVLTEAEKDLGVVVVDIGGGTTDVAVVMDGAVALTAVIPVGGNHVTSDLAVGLKTSRVEAECLKREYGCAMSSMLEGEELLEVLTADGSRARPMTRRAIADIIEPRMQELFSLVQKHLKQQGFENVLTGFVLSGGGSLLHGSLELAQEVLRMPGRIGRPRDVIGQSDELNSPVFATAVGLLYFGAARQAHERQEARAGHFVSHALEQLRNWLLRLFGG